MKRELCKSFKCNVIIDLFSHSMQFFFVSFIFISHINYPKEEEEEDKQEKKNQWSKKRKTFIYGWMNFNMIRKDFFPSRKEHKEGAQNWKLSLIHKFSSLSLSQLLKRGDIKNNIHHFDIEISDSFIYLSKQHWKCILLLRGTIHNSLFVHASSCLLHVIMR